MVTVHFTGDYDAELTRLDGERAWLLSPRPSAPGTPLRGRLGDGREVRVKVARCVRRGERFELEGRLVDVERALRLELQRALEAGSAEASATEPTAEVTSPGLRRSSDS